MYAFAGFGQSGQLGQGSTVSIGMTPNTMGDALPAIDLGEGRNASAVAPGGTHTCAGLCAAQKRGGGGALSQGCEFG